MKLSRYAALLGCITALLVLAVLYWFAFGLFTGGGVFVAGVIAFVAGIVVAGLLRTTWLRNAGWVGAVVAIAIVTYMFVAASGNPVPENGENTIAPTP